jgi:hypothetical protein
MKEWEEVQNRTAEYPPALRNASQRKGNCSIYQYGGSNSNLITGLAGRSNNEYRTPKEEKEEI